MDLHRDQGGSVAAVCIKFKKKNTYEDGKEERRRQRQRKSRGEKRESQRNLREKERDRTKESELWIRVLQQKLHIDVTNIWRDDYLIL